MNAAEVKRLARECGFELAGIASAAPPAAFSHFDDWRRRGFAGSMDYLTDHRGDLRRDPRSLLPSARSVICVAKLYHTAAPHTRDLRDPARGWISRYAWGRDYHRSMRRALRLLVRRMREQAGDFDWRICVDTAPLLERDFARAAGLGWIGKNTCLIDEQTGSWYFLGEVLVSLELEPGSPAPDRCGTCRRCIDACPTQAIVPREGRWEIDARRCISYLTIELRGPMPREFRGKLAGHLFGCDICQDVCPWNRRAPVTAEPGFQPLNFAPRIAEILTISEEEFARRFRGTPVWRAGREGLIRNAEAVRADAAR
jgi:epoxyqueuosine reductase